MTMPRCGSKCLACCAPRERAVGIDVVVGEGLNAVVFDGVRGAKLAPHLPANPEQQNAAGKQQANDLEELRGHAGERNAQHRGRHHADQNGLAPLVRWEPRGSEPDHDRVVAGENEIDQDHLNERSKHIGCKEMIHGRPVAETRRGPAPLR